MNLRPGYTQAWRGSIDPPLPPARDPTGSGGWSHMHVHTHRHVDARGPLCLAKLDRKCSLARESIVNNKICLTWFSLLLTVKQSTTVKLSVRKISLFTHKKQALLSLTRSPPGSKRVGEANFYVFLFLSISPPFISFSSVSYIHTHKTPNKRTCAITKT